MRSIDLDSHLIAEDPTVMEDCLLELPPFGSFPMRGFRKASNDDLDVFLESMTTKTISPSSKTIAA